MLSPIWDASTLDAGISAPVGHAWTHSPQATHEDSPIGSSISKTIFASCPRPANPMTSFTWTSLHARTHKLHWMHASRFTFIATWLSSNKGILSISNSGNLLAETSSNFAMSHKWDDLSCAFSFDGWSVTNNSITIFRADFARWLSVLTTISGVGVLIHDAANVRSPSISTIHALQLPSDR